MSCRMAGSGGQVSFFEEIPFESWKDWCEHKEHDVPLQGADAWNKLGHG